MGRCICHPEIESPLLCMKHNIYLCDECLTCRDPDIFCKHRSSCPIWFMTQRKLAWDAEEAADGRAAVCRVTFQPEGKEATVPAGSTLLEAADAADVHLNASCSGKGSCGKCKLVVESGDLVKTSTPLLSDQEKAKGYVLACQTQVKTDVTVRIPEESIQQRMKVAGMGEAATARLKGLVETVDPMLHELHLNLTVPTLDDSVSDLDRLRRGMKMQGWDLACLNVGLGVIRQLSEAVRQGNWEVTVSIIRHKCAQEIVDVRPGGPIARSMGLAIDVGTTTIVAYLVDMSDGTILGAASGHNRQAACGDDVINRIVCAEKDGVKKLSRMALATINSLVGQTLDSAGADAGQIRNVVVSGNTTMVHLLLQIEPRYIRRAPYVPTISEFPILKAGEIGLKAHPTAAVFIMPGPASYVGGDIVSGLLYAGFHREDPLTLFIDVGTNGEIVVGNKEWLMTAACSAGPAFEGGGIRWGMRAEEGAIERITIHKETRAPEYATVGDAAPRGICGSGMIDLMSELLNAGIIDRSGKFFTDLPTLYVRRIKDEWAYVLAFADQTPMGEDIIFTESDVKNLMYSKGAVYAGFTTLLKIAGLQFAMIDKVIISGGFGRYIDIEKAVRIGLLPDIERSKFIYLGNSSIVGAYMALLSGEYRHEAGRVCSQMTYIDFSSHPNYMDEFTSALFLPHTNLDMFPSVVARSA
jgi:uncharacterized 2Fe-2S/4Fe-4S cluster protein (DUF4445 family)